MLLLSFLRSGLLLLVPLSITLTTYLYLYPFFHGCAFPLPDTHITDASPFLDALRQNGAPITPDFLATVRQHVSFDGGAGTAVAPFRLLALGDPQLEGDTSIPDPEAFSLPNLFLIFSSLTNTTHSPLHRLRFSLHAFIDLLLADIPSSLDGYRKRLDLVGNDYYLAHIYRTLYWWTVPTHVSVLGDLVGSQWIDDDEFAIRSHRFWTRVFKGGLRVPDDITDCFVPGTELKTHVLGGEDAETWKRRVINIAGNHDVGYAGDLTAERFERFEKVFGRANYELRFRLPIDAIPIYNNTDVDIPRSEVPELRIVVLNDMNLDTPAGSKDLQDVTYRFLNDVINASPDVSRPALFTLLLTHIPLHKMAGVCVDAPYFAFHDSDEFAYGVKEQNHLSDTASRGILEGLFGMSGDRNAAGKGVGRHGMIVTGHDHEGCDVYHYIDQFPPVTADALDAQEALVDAETVLEEQASHQDLDAVVETTESESSAIDAHAVASDTETAPEDQASSRDLDAVVETSDSGSSAQISSIETDVLEQEPVVAVSETDFEDMEAALAHSEADSEPADTIPASSTSSAVSETESWESSTTPPYVTDSDSFSSFGPTPTLETEPSTSSSERSPDEAQSIDSTSPTDTETETAQSILPDVVSSVVSDSEWSIPFILDPEPTMPSELELPSADLTDPEWSFPFVYDPQTSLDSEVQPSEPTPTPEPWKPEWSAIPYAHAALHTSEHMPLPHFRHSGIPGVREVTLRSMMGEFSGHAGLISLWFDAEMWEWKSEVADCALGKQHWWWAVHVVDLITLGGILLWGIFAGIKKVVGCELVVRVPGEERIQSWFTGAKQENEEKKGKRMERENGTRVSTRTEQETRKEAMRGEEVALRRGLQAEVVDSEDEPEEETDEESGEEETEEESSSEESQRRQESKTPATALGPQIGYLRLVATPSGTSKRLRRVAAPNRSTSHRAPAPREQEPTPDSSVSGASETSPRNAKAEHLKGERRVRGGRRSSKLAGEEAVSSATAEEEAAPAGGYQGPHEKYAKYIFLTDLTGSSPRHLQVLLPNGWDVHDDKDDNDREQSVPSQRDEIEMRVQAPDSQPQRRRVRAAKIVPSIEENGHASRNAAPNANANPRSSGTARESSFYSELQRVGNRTLKGHEFYGNGSGNDDASASANGNGNGNASVDHRERRRSPRLASGSVFEP